MRIKVLLVCMLVLVPVAAWRMITWRRTSHRTPYAASPVVSPTPTRPNILLISLDTVRPDHLGCYGYRRPTSPNLDRFAAGATRFTQAHAQAPWTVPSHMSLFTSMLPSSNRVDSMFLTLPTQTPTLAELLRHAGYRTGGIVNSGGVQSAYGFGRGFETYEEYDTVKPESHADHISAQALGWMAKATRTPLQPWFLFLHYFDAHNPYHSPEPFHSNFGALPDDQTEKMLFDHYRPGLEFEGPRQLEMLKNSYDAGIAFMDSELGKVLSAVPPNTIVVVFSDHGEAFREHGWLWHSATLYEEEIRCTLIIGYVGPDGRLQRDWAPGPITGSGPATSDQPVMLMDVAPTILSACGIAAPPTFQGSDLRPLFTGGTLPGRTIASETKAMRAGQVAKCLIRWPWKLIYNMFDGHEELYRLPDEQTDLLAKEPKVAATLHQAMRAWVAQEKFWLIYMTGDGEFTGTVDSANGRLTTVIPIGVGATPGEQIDLAGDEQQQLQWLAKPGKKVEALYIETLPPDALLEAELKIDQQIRLDRVFIGKSNVHPATMATELWIGPEGLMPPPEHPRISLGPENLLSPFIDQPFQPPLEVPGFYVRRFSGEQIRAGGSGPTVDPKTLQQLKSLGYMQ